MESKGNFDYLKSLDNFYTSLIGESIVRGLHDRDSDPDKMAQDYAIAAQHHFSSFHPEYGRFRLEPNPNSRSGLSLTILRRTQKTREVEEVLNDLSTA